eukprot:PhM_4_TR2113/c0_g1_i1/m.57579
MSGIWSLLHLIAVICVVATTAQLVPPPLSGTITHHTAIPPARLSGHMFELNSNLYLLGGLSTTTPLYDLWMHNMSTAKWFLLRPNFGGYPMRVGSMHWLTQERELFVFGGFDDGYGYVGDLYSAHIDKSKIWRKDHLDVEPDARANGITWMYDSTTLALVGGRTQSTIFMDMWLYNTTGNRRKWWQVSTTGSHLIPRTEGSLCGSFDASTNRVYVYLTAPVQVWILDLKTLVWQQVTDAKGTLPPSLESTMCADAAGKLAMFGGLSLHSYTESFFTFDLGTHTWAIHSNLPKARTLAAVGVVQDKIYCFGGQVDSGRTNSMLELSPANGAMRTVHGAISIALPRSGHSASLLGDTTFVFGGKLNGALGDMWAIDKTFNWVRKLTPTSPRPRYGHIAWAQHGDVFILGGAFDALTILSDFWRYSVAENQWQKLSDSTNVRRRMDTFATAYEDSAFVYGGRLWDHFSNDLWRFDHPTLTWNKHAVLSKQRPSAMAYTNNICNGTHVFIFGGMFNSGLVNDNIWVYTMKSSMWARTGAVVARNPSQQLTFLRTAPLRTEPGVAALIVSFSTAGDVQLHIWLSNQTAPFPVPRSTLHGDMPIAIGEVVISGHSIIMVGGMSKSAPATSDLTRIDVQCLNGNGCLECRPGSYRAANGVCEFCPPGSYTTRPDLTVCQQCEQGTYSVLSGAASDVFCTKCKEGTFANVTGAQACIPCTSYRGSEGLTCDEGSVSPHKPLLTQSATSVVFSGSESKREHHVEIVTDIVGFGVAIAVCTLLFIFLMMTVCRAPLRRFFAYCDVFCWDNHASMCNEHFTICFPTPLGGLFSLLLITVTLLLCIFVSVRPMIQNQFRFQHLLHMPSHRPVAGHISMTITFQSSAFYGGGECVCWSPDVPYNNTLRCTRSGSTCTLSYSATLTAATRKTNMTFVTNVAPKEIDIKLQTATSDLGDSTVTLNLQPRTPHELARFSGKVVTDVEVLPTYWHSSRSSSPDSSGWNMRAYGTQVEREYLVRVEETAGFTPVTLVFALDQLQEEVYVVMRDGLSPGFVVGIVVAIIGGTFLTGKAVFRLVESVYYRRAPHMTPWFIFYRKQVQRQHAIGLDHLRRSSLGRPDEVQVVDEATERMKLLNDKTSGGGGGGNKDVFVFHPREVRPAAGVDNVNSMFEIPDTETLKANILMNTH